MTTLEFANAGPLIRALANGVLFSSSDVTLQAINVVRFEHDGTTLKVACTDRYRLCVETIDHSADTTVEPFVFSLPRDAAKQALGVLKAAKREAVTFMYDAEASTLSLRTYTSTTAYSTHANAFPPYERLIPSLDDVKPADAIGFSVSFLADLAKVQTATKLQAVAVRLFGPNKPTRIDYIDGPTVVLMPHRLPTS